MHSSVWTTGVTLLIFCLGLLSSEASSKEATAGNQSTAISGQDADTWKNEVLEWRAKHVAELQKPDGWLSLAGLEWLESGSTTFGSGGDNKIHLAGAPEHLGVLELKNDVVRLLPPPGGFPKDFLVAAAPATEQVLPVETDNDAHAVHLTIGTLNFYVIRRADKFALRVKDSRSKALLEFHGLKWYDPDPRYRFQAKWIPYHPAKSVTLATLTGTSYSELVPGAVEFTFSDETYRLEPVLEAHRPDRLFFILRDSTSASTTYGACRFLYTSLPTHGLDQDGQLTLDFNHLENPPCAYTPFATCPLPPQGNRLKLALPVGELRFHE
jgi:uncharacterized protein (DUF1684 family)